MEKMGKSKMPKMKMPRAMLIVPLNLKSARPKGKRKAERAASRGKEGR